MDYLTSTVPHVRICIFGQITVIYKEQYCQNKVGKVQTSCNISLSTN